MLTKSADELKQKRVQLNLKHSKCPALFFLHENARFIDSYFIESLGKGEIGSSLKEDGHSCAIVALGGYGRSEQCVASDVDVMILFDGNVPKKAEELIREIVYPLWDIGLDVGHATRTISECLELVDESFEILTSLLDARFICGERQIFSRMITLLKASVQASEEQNILLIKNKCCERHDNFGDSSDLLEPNLKNGLGGLRDYHAMLWLGKVRSFITNTEDLQKNPFFADLRCW